MFIAQEKRKTNIAEYIIYMWQVEDIIRALKLDIDRIEEVMVNQYSVEEDKKKELKYWYQNLVLMMQKEQKQSGGHLQFLINLTDELNRFHLTLIEGNIDIEYGRLFSDIESDIQLVREKSGQNHHNIEVALNTLYLILMLKMKNQEISEGTQEVVWKFGNFLGNLSRLFKAWEAGDLVIEDQ